MNKITADHLARKAIVYIRQSSEYQVRHNTGSLEWQYGIKARMWTPPAVQEGIRTTFAACGQVLSYVRPLKCSIHALRAHMVFVDRSQIAPAVC